VLLGRAVVWFVLVVCLAVAGCGSTTSSTGTGATRTGGSSGGSDDGGSGYFSDGAGGSPYFGNGSDYGGGVPSDEQSEDETAQVDWENQEGDRWDEFNRGYVDGWEEGCDAAFEGSPDGYLYEDGNQYSADDCYALAPDDATDADIPSDEPYAPYTDGEALGMTDACTAAFDELTRTGFLNYGETTFDSGECP
jgi:hypothetical protein